MDFEILSRVFDGVKMDFCLLTVYCSSGPTAAIQIETIIAREIVTKDEPLSTAAERKKHDPWVASGFPEIHSKRSTAADTVEAIIAKELGVTNSDGMTGGAEWKKAGSQTSVCSDNTSDTLSADEGQRDEEDTRPRRALAAETPAGGIGSAVLTAVADHNRNGSGPPGQPTSSTNGPGLAPDVGIFPAFLQQSGGSGSQMPPTKQALASFQKHYNSSKPPDAQHTLANGNSQPVLAAGSLVASVLGRGMQPLRVRDVIHTAIEENLQSSNATPTGLWHRGLLPMPRSAVTADTPNESVQDLSIRTREPQSTSVKAPPASPLNCVGPHGIVGLLRAEKSPPPAHSHYGRPPVAVMPPPPPIIDRCQDPLYHLAEVALQSSRVEMFRGQNHSSLTPAGAAGYSRQPVLYPSELDRSDRGVSAQHGVGSITLGTPRHLVTGDMLSRPLVPAADVSHRNPPQHTAKVNDGCVELAQEALRYLSQPDPSQRAVMEQVMAQVGGSFATSNPSHTILMGDYITAQQMQTSQYQQTSQPLTVPLQRYPHHQSLDHHTSMSSARIPDLLDGVRMMTSGTDIAVNHVPVVQHRPQLTERPQHTTVLSQLMRGPITAATVIDAIITHQINKEVPVSGMTAGTVLNRLPDPQVGSSTAHRVTGVNGSAQLGSIVACVDAGTVAYPAQHSVAEHLERECGSYSSSHPAVAFRSKDMSKSTAVTQMVTRAVTLGEHIENMIHKDFSNSIYDSPPHAASDVSRSGKCSIGLEF